MKLSIAVVALLVFAAPARADWQIDRGLQIARVVWHNPCADRSTISFMSQAEMNQGHVLAPGDYVGALSVPSECRIILSDELESHGWEVVCSFLIHESGHLAGFRDLSNPSDPLHSSNPRSIMNHYVPDDARCYKRGRPFLELHGVLSPRFH